MQAHRYPLSKDRERERENFILSIVQVPFNSCYVVGLGRHMLKGLLVAHLCLKRGYPVLYFDNFYSFLSNSLHKLSIATQ